MTALKVAGIAQASSDNSDGVLGIDLEYLRKIPLCCRNRNGRSLPATVCATCCRRRGNQSLEHYVLLGRLQCISSG